MRKAHGTHSKRPASMPARHQEGVVLFIALVVLLIITVLGISGLQTTTLEERMAASSRDRDLAFRAAEAALTQGEAFTQSLTLTDFSLFNNSNGLYRPVTSANVDDWWESVDWVNDSLRSGSITVSGVATQPKYIVEYQTRILADEDKLNISNVGASVGMPTDIFRITSYGTGGSDRAIVMLQATRGVAVGVGP